MASFQAPNVPPGANPGGASAPLVALFERDDSVAVPLLSLIRLAGYDVRAARTPVDLFDVLAKHPVALVLIDLGGATAGRREFWVALDARRRGKAMQVMTFRVKEPPLELDPDEGTARALADVEVSGPLEFAQIIEAVRARLPLHGAAPGVAIGTLPPGTALPGDASPQFGRALGAISTFMPAFSPGPPSQFGTLYGPPGSASSPFAQPSQLNPFSTSFPNLSSPSSWSPGTSGSGGSPFSQPYSDNPFNDNPFGASDPAGWMGAGGPALPPLGPPPFGPGFTPGSARGPFGDSNPPGAGNFSSPHGFSPGWSAPSQPGANRPWGSSQPGAFGASHPSGKVPAQPSIADRWTPPDHDAAGRAFEEQETGVVPELAARPIENARHPDFGGRSAGEAPAAASLPGGWMAAVRAAASAGAGSKPLSPRDEEALSNVLVEGAMLSPQTLEVLRGVQQMLSTVEMKLNIGELAMIFKFLSRDQYLAALLVSRGMVTPQQIASLGRVKQQLAASGQDHDLETLLAKYKVLRPEHLAAIRSELGSR
jgi:hypothetical protein